MEKVKSDSFQDKIRDAATLWEKLTSAAGLDLEFYDSDILHGTGSFQGLYSHLRISKIHRNFVDDLKENDIQVESFLKAFLNTLQPYAQMMSDICAFFQRRKVNETNKSLKIVFDFSEVNGGDFKFDLENFRSVIETIELVKGIGTYRRFNSTRDYYDFFNEFRNESIEYPLDEKATKWILTYENHQKFAGFDEFLWPVTESEHLNAQINRLESIWKAVMNACTRVGSTGHIFRGINIGNGDPSQDVNGFSLEELYILVADRWPSNFVIYLFKIIENAQSLNPSNPLVELESLAENIKRFVDERSVPSDEVEDLIRKLEDLLKLPVWSRRHELYAVWVLSLCDGILGEFPGYVLHHQEGKLLLPFRKTHIASFETSEGKVELYSESKEPIEKPKGKSRKKHIQPDYTLYKGSKASADDALVVVEVKQYRTPDTSNFRNALNDYATALPNANVFLTNYGAVPRTIDHLTHESRSHFFGQIRPGSSSTTEFAQKIRICLPPKYKLSLLGIELSFVQELLLVFKKNIYVDVSASQDYSDYKESVRVLLESLLRVESNKKLVAIDDIIRQEWNPADSSSISELLNLNFYRFTNFRNLIDDHDFLVITDDEGADQIRFYYPPDVSGHMVVFTEGRSPVFQSISTP